MSGRSFSWRQPAIALIGASALSIPFVCAAAWLVHGDQDGLRRAHTARLPLFAVAQSSRTPDPRVLFLDRASSSGAVRWAITRLKGPAMGDEDFDDGMRKRLEPVIADLASPRGTDAGELLSTFAIAYVATPADADQSLVSSLDLAPALSRVAYVGSVRLWSPTGVTGRVLLVPPTEAAMAVAAPPSSTWSDRGVGRGPTRLARAAGTKQQLRIGAQGGSVRVPGGVSGRMVLVSVPKGSGWQATYNGKRLPEQRAWGWAAAFTIPAESGTLTVSHHDAGSLLAGLGSLAALLVVFVLAAPELRRPGYDTPPPVAPEPPAAPDTGAEPANIKVMRKS